MVSVYSCSNPSHRSGSSSNEPRVFDGWIEPSGDNTSHITSEAFLRHGSLIIRTGFSKQSDEWPSACCVLDPSKFQPGQSSTFLGSLSTIFVLLRRVGSGL